MYKGVEAVDPAGVGEKHVGALVGDDGDAAILAEFHGEGRASVAVDPDALHAGFGALPDEGSGHVRRGDEEHAIDRRSNVGDRGEAGYAFDLRNTWMDGHGIVPAR